MGTLQLFLAFCGLISCSAKSQLTLESEKGGLKLKNFRHLHKHRLNVVPMASFEIGKEMKCTTSCTKSDGCFSFNVKKLTENSFLCELLNTTKSIDAENLTQDDSFTHYNLQVRFLIMNYYQVFSYHQTLSIIIKYCQVISNNCYQVFSYIIKYHQRNIKCYLRNRKRVACVYSVIMHARNVERIPEEKMVKHEA